ncbi:hypothetical protein GSI_06581 [Ganoderma sinense ZZ0214-1]|uniref:BRCT domain-containing protein n=1 Tax=Ganoderma sinense ZZ0214-1 TaxID=1077348 RepID=A0A2G8SDS9_9APHY|nr:hypothetical protein GSI_06581 [Ganoderma sinense ZZ0214-1]
MDQDPPSTQVAGRLFVDSANRPLKVFVDAAVVNRVKVGRSLKKGGANIIKDLKDADIIIVETESQTGDTTAADWGSEKVVLEPGWVSHSVQRGKVFLENEKWGGFEVVTTPVGADTGVNHLPTPRVTPSEAKLSPNEPPMPNQHRLTDASQAAAAAGSPGPPPSQFPQQAAFQVSGGQHIGAMPMATISPDAQVVVPANLLPPNLLWSLVNQAGIGIPMQVPQFQTLPMAMAQGGFPQQGIQFMTPGMFPQGGFIPQGGYPQQMMGIPMSQPMQDIQPPSGELAHASASPDVHSRNDSVAESHRGSPMDQDDPSPSLKRKTRPSDASGSGSKKKKGKAREGDRPLKHARLSESCDEAPLPFSDSPPPATQHRRQTSDHIGSLFVKHNGHPYTFFVQIEIRNRSKLADAIKKNGGKIAPDIAKVDFVILAHPSQRNFEEWLRQSNYFGKLPIKPQWIYRSVERGKILDFMEFLYEGFEVEKKRGRPGASGQRYVLKVVKSPTEEGTASEEDQLEDEHEEDEEVDEPAPKSKGKEKVAVKKPTIVKKETVKAEKKAKERKAAKKTEQRAEPAKIKAKSKTKSKEPSSTPTQSGRWEPSPPPPTRTEPHSRGHLYTKEDRDYCDEYIPILLSRDYTMTTMQIAEKLNEKMPHHSTKSWATHMSTSPLREKMLNWKKRAGIRHRKDAGQRSASKEDRQSTPPGGGPSKSLAAPQMIDPFQIIASFFAQGNADALTDEEVWRMMEGQYPQLTARQWEDFWVKNNDEITDEVNRLTSIEDSQIPKTEPE